MEIKIVCPCGTKYKFDVEAIDRLLPAPVYCPVCHADGSTAANLQIAESLRALAIPVPESPRPVASPSPVRLGVAAPVQHSVSTPQEPPQPTVILPGAQKRQKEQTGPSNIRGMIGSAVAGLVGMIVWAFLIIVTNHEIGWVAWGVGGLVGFGAKTFGKSETAQIGLAAALAAFAAILAGQIIATRHTVNQFTDTLVNVAYAGEMAYAKEAVAAQNEAQIRAVLARHESDSDKTIEPSAITAARISAFQQELPSLKKLAGGKVSKADYQRDHALTIDTGFILKNSFSFFTLLWISLGVGTAYRVASAG